MITDESSFIVRPTKNRLRICRKPGMGLIQRYNMPTYRFGYQTVSVWGGLYMYGCTALIGNISSFEKDTYRIIIDSHVLPFMEQKNGGTESFVLQ